MIDGKDRPLTGRFRKLWYRLTEPHVSIEDPERRYQARLLASLLIAFIILTMLVILTFVAPSGSEVTLPLLQNPDFYITLGAGLLFTVAYGLNRAGRYTPAALLAVTTISIGAFATALVVFTGANPYYETTDASPLAYMIVPALFASVLLPTPVLVAVVTINVIGMLLVPVFFPQVTLVDIISGPMTFVLPVYIFIPVAAHHRRRLESHRRGELVEKETRYRRLLETTFEGTITIERGRVIDANEGFARMFGYSPSEVISMRLLDFIAEESRDLTLQNVEEGVERPAEALGIRRDGTRFHVELVAQTSLQQGRAVRVVAVRDISERKQAEEVLRQQNRERALLNQVGRAISSTLDLNQVLVTILEEVRRLLNVAAASIWLIDPETGELVCRQAVGPPSDGVRGWRLAPGEGFAGWVAASGKALTVPDTRSDTRHFKEVDRETGVEQRSILSVPLYAQERVIGVLQVLDTAVDRFRPRDLRLVESLAPAAAIAIENARLYEETEELRAFNENIVQSMNEGILLEDATGHITFVNPKTEELLGYTAEELTGWHWQTIVPPEYVAEIEEEVAKRFRGIASQYETVVLTRAGDRLPVSISARPLFEGGQFSGVLSVFADISERKQAEEEIRRRAAQQQALNAIIAAAAAASGLRELLETALDHTLQALGLDAGTIWVGDQWVTRGLPQERLQRIAQAAPGFLSAGFSSATAVPDVADTAAVEDWAQAKINPRTAARQIVDGLGVRASLTVPILSEGQRIGGLGLGAFAPRSWSTEEIALAEAVGRQLGGAAERLHLLEKTREQAWQVQQIVDTVQAGILLLDADLRVLLANPAAREYMDVLANGDAAWTLSHLGGRTVEELLAPPPTGLWHEVTVESPPHRVFEVAAYPVTSGADEVGSWVLVLQDVTQEREIEERVQRQERLAVVGQLAAGIAHDFNNIMSVIILYAEMMLRKPDLPPRDRERLTTISQQARQATNLTGQILDFSRASVLERHPLDLVPFLKELTKLLERTLPENIALELAYGYDEYTVNADPTRIQQVVMNLVVNARDAMPDGGRMHIGLDYVRVETNEPPPLPEMEPGQWVQMMASDTGTGIPPDALPYVFDPFFTTKAAGQGTGLGLAQVYGIVKQHGGHIDVQSELGSGTTFVIYLPALQVSQGEVLEAETAAPTQGHGETILVVEDEPAAREAVADALQSLGYRPLTAANGREALALYDQYAADVALVLSDLVMPEIDGPELFRLLKQKDPSVKIIAMTGYPLKARDQEPWGQEIVDWLQKPLNVELLGEAVGRALEG